jgi:hypothetical protein
MLKYTKLDNVAVIYSPNFGSGWYTWYQNHYSAPERMIFDPTLVEILLDRNEKLSNENDLEYRTEVLNKCQENFLSRVRELFDNFTESTFHIEDLEIGWVPRGAEFVIEEYDGCESIHFKENFKWLKA